MPILIKSVLNFIYFNYSYKWDWTWIPGKIIRFTLKTVFPGLNKKIYRLSPEISVLILAKTAEFGNSKIMLKNIDIKNQQNLDRF